MKRSRIGTIQLPTQNITLKYYVFGCRKDGYGLEIIQETNGVITQECCANISKSQQAVRALGDAVLRGVVFPGYLSELVAEWE